MTQSLPIEDGQDEGRALAADAAPGHSAEPEPCGLGPDGRVSHSAGHTPGPWRAKPWAPQECGIETAYPHPNTGKPIHIAGAVAKSDGPLIAAAPLLLEALEEMVRFHRGEGKYNFSGLFGLERFNAADDAWNAIREQIEAAISTARGGQ